MEVVNDVGTPDDARTVPTDRERMRTRFADSIDGLTGGLAATCALTVTAVSDATNALLDADLTLAERVIDASGALENDATTWEQRAFSLLPLQAPSRMICVSWSAASCCRRPTTHGWTRRAHSRE